MTRLWEYGAYLDAYRAFNDHTRDCDACHRGRCFEVRALEDDCSEAVIAWAADNARARERAA